MPGSSTVIIAREDLSIPGAESDKGNPPPGPAEFERRFFALVHENRPDVVVLDLSRSNGDGIAAILKIRQKCAVPVLVVHSAGDVRAADYRIAGAADCIAAPVDIIRLNEMILHIKRVMGQDGIKTVRQPAALAFAGVTFRPDKRALSDLSGASVRLTTVEHDLLSHLLSRPWEICGRSEIAEILYGRHRPKSDRAIDVIVARLRKKLISLRGPAAENLVQTKHRWGYMLAADVSSVLQPDGLQSRPHRMREGEQNAAAPADLSPA